MTCSVTGRAVILRVMDDQVRTPGAQPVAAQVIAAIRRKRRDLEWSQHSLAAAAGMHRSVIANMETGHRESITVDEMCALAAALNVTPASLLPTATTEARRCVSHAAISRTVSIDAEQWNAIRGAFQANYAGETEQEQSA